MVEPPGSTEQFAESQLQALAVVKRPVLVGIERQQFARVDGQRTLDGVDVVARQTLRGKALEGERVDVEVGARKSATVSALSTMLSGAPVALRTKWVALYRRLATDSNGTSGQSASITCRGDGSDRPPRPGT